MTMKPRLLEALSTVARMTAWNTVPKREKMAVNSTLKECCQERPRYVVSWMAILGEVKGETENV